METRAMQAGPASRRRGDEKAITLAALVAIALAVGMGTVVAVSFTDYVATGTGTLDFSNATLDKHHLYFTDDTDPSARDSIHMGNGDDRLNLGAGNDVIGFAYGSDVLDLSGGHDYITWGIYSGWPSAAQAVNYISCDTPDQGETAYDSSMEIRSDEVTIKSNLGDVIIQLGGS